MRKDHNTFSPAPDNPFIGYDDNNFFGQDNALGRLIASGSAIGAAAGSVVPVLGTAVGGAVGAVGGAIKEGISALKKGKKNDDALSLQQWGNVTIALMNGATGREGYEIFTKFSDLKYAKTRRSVWNSVFGKVGKNTWDKRDDFTENQRIAMIKAALGEVNRFMQKTGKTISIPGLTQEDITKAANTPTRKLLKRKEQVEFKSGGDLTVNEKGKVMKNVIDPVFTPILPLTPVMRTALKDQGVTPSTNIEVLTNQFYNNVVKDNPTDNFTGDNPLPYVNTKMMRGDHADAAKEAIVTAVITYINGLKEARNEGEELSSTESKIVNTTEHIEKQVQDQIKQSAANKIGDELLFSDRTPLYIGGVIFFIILLVVVLKK